MVTNTGNVDTWFFSRFYKAGVSLLPDYSVTELMVAYLARECGEADLPFEEGPGEMHITLTAIIV
jgi:hypothetical protein